MSENAVISIVIQNISNVCGTSAYCFRDQRILRCLAVVSNALWIVWALIALTGGNLLTSVLWSVAVILINGVHLFYDFVIIPHSSFFARILPSWFVKRYLTESLGTAEALTSSPQTSIQSTHTHTLSSQTTTLPDIEQPQSQPQPKIPQPLASIPKRSALYQQPSVPKTNKH
jgi:hypothetical protein